MKVVLPQWGAQLAFFWLWCLLPLVAALRLQVRHLKSSKLLSERLSVPGLLLEEGLLSLSLVSFWWWQRGLVWTQQIHPPMKMKTEMVRSPQFGCLSKNGRQRTWIGMLRERRWREAKRVGHRAPKPNGGGIRLEREKIHFCLSRLPWKPEQWKQLRLREFSLATNVKLPPHSHKVTLLIVSYWQSGCFLFISGKRYWPNDEDPKLSGLVRGSQSYPW